MIKPCSVSLNAPLGSLEYIKTPLQSIAVLTVPMDGLQITPHGLASKNVLQLPLFMLILTPKHVSINAGKNWISLHMTSTEHV